MLTYVGKGYSPDFVANYDSVAERLGAGEDILLVSGPDDICAPLCGTQDDHCRNDSPAERDDLAARAVGDLLGIVVRRGRLITLTADTIAAMRTAFARGEIRAACTGCQWFDLCTQVAGRGFQGARLIARGPQEKA